jgi:GMP synthase (glutamine-hydrolysing)
MNTPILIVKTGDTLPELAATEGDFEHWIARGLRASGLPLAIAVADPRAPLGHPLPQPAALAESGTAVVVTGSHAMVTDREAWSEATARWLGEAVALGVPVLGICYGHQLLAHAMGGQVAPHPGGLEMGTVTVQRTPQAAEDPLFSALPDTWSAPVAHRQSVRRLPPGALHLAGNGFETHHAYRVGRCAWGVQFHPEFSPAATRAYVAHLADDLRAQGQCPQTLETGVTDTPQAARVLARFAELAHQACHP